MLTGDSSLLHTACCPVLSLHRLFFLAVFMHMRQCSLCDRNEGPVCMGCESGLKSVRCCRYVWVLAERALRGCGSACGDADVGREGGGVHVLGIDCFEGLHASRWFLGGCDWVEGGLLDGGMNGFGICTTYLLNGVMTLLGSGLLVVGLV